MFVPIVVLVVFAVVVTIGRDHRSRLLCVLGWHRIEHRASAVPRAMCDCILGGCTNRCFRSYRRKSLKSARNLKILSQKIIARSRKRNGSWPKIVWRLSKSKERWTKNAKRCVKSKRSASKRSKR
uniref:Putative secreted protein n=1 Tax=Anopheles triannulatus TaxID=58253 RepID=A0A2M4B100_9DIPT